jgi:hypothetical protein
MARVNPSPLSPASTQLLELYDELSEYEAKSAFFMDSVAALSLSPDSWLDQRSVQGLCFTAQSLKESLASLAHRLDEIRQ